MLNGVELFAGAGGLGMGLSLAGLRHRAVVEWDKWACETIRENRDSGFPLVKGWPVQQCDVRKFDYSGLNDDIDIVSGGPPCQPFSLGGKHRAHFDDRDMFPAAVRVIRNLRPRAFILENVKGLTRSSFANYFQYILLQLAMPNVVRRSSEGWLGHLARLEKEQTSGRETWRSYSVLFRVLNAADYGVPQKRERVFIVGFRNDQNVKWNFPEPTHSVDALIADQWMTRDYWQRHEITKSQRPEIPQRLKRKVAALRALNDLPGVGRKPWRTVRDALVDLPDPEGPNRSDHFFHNHHFQPGARVYHGHTGSPLDLPAKALKAGDHGVPGGENMIVKDSGAVRYFTVREAARLQTFPDGFRFHGSWTETMRQLGNAVPVSLAKVVASSVAEKLLETDANEWKRLIARVART